MNLLDKLVVCTFEVVKVLKECKGVGGGVFLIEKQVHSLYTLVELVCLSAYVCLLQIKPDMF